MLDLMFFFSNLKGVGFESFDCVNMKLQEVDIVH